MPDPTGADGTRGPDGPCRAADHLEELALGILGGRQRAEVLAHIEGCPVCAGRQRQLGILSDSLLDLLPAAEPPVGFENRVLGDRNSEARVSGDRVSGDRVSGDRVSGDRVSGDRVIGDRAPPRHAGWPPAARRTRRRAHGVWSAQLAVVAACAAGLFVGGFALRQATSGQTTRALPSDRPLRVAPLRTGARTVGDVYLDPGTRPWVYVDVHGLGPSPRQLYCTLTFRDGRIQALGDYAVTLGSVEWQARIAGDLRQVTGARLTAPGGTTVATAVFSR